MRLCEMDTDECYAALTARDSRFDGRLFVGVRTTGIYCRPVCPARTPKLDNCGFFPSAAAAERAGFRPCLRCRPELAPGNASVDAVSRLAAAAASAIEDGALTEMSVEGMAAGLGVTSRHLRRAVEREFGVPPIALAQTHRLLTAKRLLTDTRLPMTEVAFASGFESLRRFNAVFRERYHLKPGELRKGSSEKLTDDPLVCEVAFRPPFDWDAHLRYLGKRAIPGVERVDGSTYLRVAPIGKAVGWVSIGLSQHPDRLRVRVSESLAPKLVAVVARVKRLCDTSANPVEIGRHLAELAARRPGLRVPGAFDGFEVSVRAILGQQISVSAATTLAGRFARAFGEPVETPFDGLCRAMPPAERVAALDSENIASLGVIRSRAETIVALARSVAAGEVILSPRAEMDETMARLKRIPGVGEWTAQYIAMRALAWPDAFPSGDLGLRRALGVDSEHAARERVECYRPWRAYAAMHLWKSLEEEAE